LEVVGQVVRAVVVTKPQPALLLLLLLPIASAATALETDALDREADVYLVPIGSLPDDLLLELANYYEVVLGLDVEVTGSLPFESSMRDNEREQLIAEKLLLAMGRGFRGWARNPQPLFVGITERDIYTTRENWRFAFAVRGQAEDHPQDHLRRQAHSTSAPLPTGPRIGPAPNRPPAPGARMLTRIWEISHRMALDRCRRRSMAIRRAINEGETRTMRHRSISLTAMFVVVSLLFGVCLTAGAANAAANAKKKPNILVIWGDDIGNDNVSAYHRGMMGGSTPNIDRLADEGLLMTDAYAQQSCTAGRANFMLGQNPYRSGCCGASFFTRSNAKRACVYIGYSIHKVPSLSKVAMRSAGST
jgi:hypothetical protein